MSRYKTPLRYPGGKQKLSQFILELMMKNDLVGGHYAEPYAGGAGIAFELLLNGDATHVHLNDSCPGVYAFWRSVLCNTESLCRRISRASLTVKEWRRQKAIFARRAKLDCLDVGFSTFYLNRCNRSGILSGGLIGGLNQDGEWRMDARFPRGELIRRIEAIAAKAKYVTLRNWDAERFMRHYIPSVRHKTLVYCDPPYFHKAERLYLNHYNRKDHARIAEVIQRELEHPWVTSYDAVDEVRRLYSGRRSFVYDLHYNANRAYRGAEVFIFSDDLKIPKESVLSGVNQGLINIRRSSSRSMS